MQLLALASLLVISAARTLISSVDLGSPVNLIEVNAREVYASSLNRISRFEILAASAGFELRAEVRTGPLLDSALCNFDSTACLRNAKLAKRNYISRLLHVVPDGVLECGSLRQGVCQLRSPTDLSVIYNGSVPIVPNDANSSCVSLVDVDGEGVLYVAATYTSDSPYRESMPAVSSRHPPHYNTINAGSIEGEAAVHIRAEYRGRFKVRYVSAFFHEHYVYVVSVQNKYLSKSLVSNPIISKLIRICKDDDRYISYSEIEVQCRGADNRNFNVVTAAVLLGDYLIASFTDEHRSLSAICVYPMQKVRLTFWYNIDRCRVGTNTVGLPHIGRDTKCINKSHLPLSEETCAMGVGGNIECDQIAVYQLDSIAESLAAVVVDNITVIIIGTNQGTIVQMRYVGTQFKNFGEDQVSSAPVSDVRIIDGRTFMAVSGTKLLLYSMSNCEGHSTCAECIASDPLCGWCLLEGTCSFRSDCTSLVAEMCPTDAAAVPSNVSVSELDAHIFIPVGEFPIANLTAFVCTFGNETASGSWVSSGIRCSMPSVKWKIASGDHVTVELRAMRSASSLPIATRVLTLYNCSVHTICSSCSASHWGCHWCPHSTTCLPPDVDCEGFGRDVKCPHIDSQLQKEILIADGSNATVAFPVVHSSEMASSSYELFCRFNVEGTVVKLAAQLVNGRVNCNAFSFSYRARGSQLLAKLDLLHGESLIDITNVTLYKCTEMASDCSACLALDPKWRCAWCAGSCSFVQHCTFYPQSHSPDVVCGQPVIESFDPRTGPVEGGTRIEIRGHDLGSSLSDVKDRVFVGGSKCEVLSYKVSSKIVCEVGSGTGSGAIQLRLGQSGRRFVDSNFLYQFVDPQPKSIYPSFGPISGGTKVTIYGTHLNVGSNASVHIGTHICNVLAESYLLHTGIVCETSRAERTMVAKFVEVRIDKSVRVLERKFEYRPDPTIKSIFPTATFESGGRTIAVEGENLDSVLNPKLFVAATSEVTTEGSVSALGDCHVQNSTLMLCLSPKVLLPPNFSPSTYSRWPVGFLMDNVQSVRDLGSRIQITVVPDPQFEPFKGVRIHRAEQLFVIEGNHLSHAATSEEYQIFIGASRCVVTLLDTRQLMCRAPPTEPPATDEKGNPIDGDRPMLTVIVGALRHELGLVEYETSSLRMPVTRLLAVLCVGTALCVSAGIFLCILYKKKKDEREKDYKRIQLKMEYLEFNVRNECKQAFAELQTDVSDLTAAVDGHGIPVHDKAEFVSRILFRETSTSSGLFCNGSLYSGQVAVALGQFDSLLWNKRFVFALVDMADVDPSFSVEERALLCSLLFAALLSNMSYCSDVVLCLLSQHITKCIQEGNAHLVFRQSGSMVEKIFSLWFSVCIFENLETGLARTLFLLCKALKCQIEKGPVDAVNGNARYSLNEHKLLREPIEANVIQLLVMPLDHLEQSPIVVRTLSCDTVYQLKMKILDAIYKNQPFSTRLSPEQFDLEWRCPRRGSVLLCNDEGLSVKGLRKLNRVVDYGIGNNALLAMQPAHAHSYSNGGAETVSSVQGARSCEPVRFYHLELPHEKGSSMNKIDDSIPKSIPEVYLTRLLTSKGTVQKFVDDFFESVLFVHQDEFPIVLKFVFDFLDDIARRNSFCDANIVRAWKTNAWVLRFWVNLISNVDCLLDVQRTASVDGSLSVIAQTLVDSFSSSQQKLGKESPSSKLLFAKDIERYRPMVGAFYRRIGNAKGITSEQFFEHVASLSKEASEGVSSSAVKSELLAWVRGNGVKLVEILSRDAGCRQQRLAERLQQTVQCSLLEPEHIYATLQ